MLLLAAFDVSSCFAWRMIELTKNISGLNQALVTQSLNHLRQKNLSPVLAHVSWCIGSFIDQMSGKVYHLWGAVHKISSFTILSLN